MLIDMDKYLEQTDLTSQGIMSSQKTLPDNSFIPKRDLLKGDDNFSMNKIIFQEKLQINIGCVMHEFF